MLVQMRGERDGTLGNAASNGDRMRCLLDKFQARELCSHESLVKKICFALESSMLKADFVTVASLFCRHGSTPCHQEARHSEGHPQAVHHVPAVPGDQVPALCGGHPPGPEG